MYAVDLSTGSSEDQAGPSEDQAGPSQYKCPICFETIPHGMVFMTSCGHIFCEPCIADGFHLKKRKKEHVEFYRARSKKKDDEDGFSCPVCRFEGIGYGFDFYKKHG